MNKNMKFAITLFIAIIILLAFTVYESKLVQESNIQFIILTIIITAIVVLMCIGIYKEKNLTVEKAFKLIVPLICIMFFVAMPMFRNHDEDTHWLRIYDIANGNLLYRQNMDIYFKKELLITLQQKYL